LITQKRFDSLSFNKLFIKLKGYGISDKLLFWIEAFLKDRKQRVLINDSKSNFIEVISGVPQGSVLGPILFIIFVNNVVDVLSSVMVCI
jgi:ribonuclease P/MRP protein subunit RPP40